MEYNIIVKYTEAPRLEIQYPLCGSCGVEVISEDGFICPACGTYWSYSDGDGDPGTLLESHSGEKVDLPAEDPNDHDVHSRVYTQVIQAERLEREVFLAKLMDSNAKKGSRNE